MTSHVGHRSQALGMLVLWYPIECFRGGGLYANHWYQNKHHAGFHFENRGWFLIMLIVVLQKLAT